ncbi:hypothetical protein HK405_013660 [Cladochytrium tenue]|nr:hypothetical protein HK405_013660 [Cladochytrium tenue]
MRSPLGLWPPPAPLPPPRAWPVAATGGPPAHGASGAVLASTLVFALAVPQARVALFFVAELPARAAVAGLVLYDVYMAATSSRHGGGSVDHAGHLGGALFGWAYWMLRLRGRGSRRLW